jgi:hypothetical protein
MFALSTVFLALTPLSGFSDTHDPISAAKAADAKAGIAAPGIKETRAIAEEGFIYGLQLQGCKAGSLVRLHRTNGRRC